MAERVHPCARFPDRRGPQWGPQWGAGGVPCCQWRSRSTPSGFSGRWLPGCSSATSAAAPTSAGGGAAAAVRPSGPRSGSLSTGSSGPRPAPSRRSRRRAPGASAPARSWPAPESSRYPRAAPASQPWAAPRATSCGGPPPARSSRAADGRTPRGPSPPTRTRCESTCCRITTSAWGSRSRRSRSTPWTAARSRPWSTRSRPRPAPRLPVWPTRRSGASSGISTSARSSTSSPPGPCSRPRPRRATSG